MVTVHSSQGSDFIVPAQHSLKRRAHSRREVGDSMPAIHLCQSAPTHYLRGTNLWHKACNGLMTQIPTGTFLTRV